MNYQQTIDYLYSHLPVFHRIGAAAYRPDLGNISALCDTLSNPQKQFRSVHVAGTNGKGSVAHMLAAVLQTAGYKTGLSTSPHLLDFRERIRINGCMIPEEDVVGFVADNKGQIEDIAPSFFEVNTAMAFWHFARQQVDIAVIETGMGGRLDSTNIITPELSIITNIGLDHIHVLGDNLKAIAGEKAGIIKEGIPVIIGEYQDETAAVFGSKALEMQAPLRFASLDWEVHRVAGEARQNAGDARGDAGEARQAAREAHVGEGLLEIIAQSAVYGKTLKVHLDLTGHYQEKNIKAVLSAVEELKKCGFVLNDTQVKDALRNVKALTGFAGRWQILSAAPLVICDTGHNEDGIRAVLQQIATTSYEKLHVVFGMVSDKNAEKILSMLPKNAAYYFCKAAVPRAMDENILREKALAAGLAGEAFFSVKKAVAAAKNAAAANDLVFIGGSTFVVAEAI